MPVKDSGQNACIVYPSWNDDAHQVTKLFVSERSMKSFARETNEEILKILRNLDPEQKEYSYALSQSSSLMGDTSVKVADIHACQALFRDERVVPLRDVSYIQLKLLTKAPADRRFTKDELESLEKSLKKLHENGIVHNDIHIHNVMINPESGTLVWTDFGEALTQKDVDESTFRELVLKDLSNFDSKIKQQFLLKKEKPKKRSRPSSFDDENTNEDNSERPSLAESLFGICSKPPASKRLLDFFT